MEEGRDEMRGDKQKISSRPKDLHGTYVRLIQTVRNVFSHKNAKNTNNITLLDD